MKKYIKKTLEVVKSTRSKFDWLKNYFFWISNVSFKKIEFLRKWQDCNKRNRVTKFINTGCQKIHTPEGGEGIYKLQTPGVGSLFLKTLLLMLFNLLVYPIRLLVTQFFLLVAYLQICYLSISFIHSPILPLTNTTLLTQTINPTPLPPTNTTSPPNH